MREEVDPDYLDDGFVKSRFLPYQQKVVYDVMLDSSELEDDESADEEELAFEEDQPYETPASIAYKESLK